MDIFFHNLISKLLPAALTVSSIKWPKTTNQQWVLDDATTVSVFSPCPIMTPPISGKRSPCVVVLVCRLQWSKANLLFNLCSGCSGSCLVVLWESKCSFWLPLCNSPTELSVYLPWYFYTTQLCNAIFQPIPFRCCHGRGKSRSGLARLIVGWNLSGPGFPCEADKSCGLMWWNECMFSVAIPLL